MAPVGFRRVRDFDPQNFASPESVEDVCELVRRAVNARGTIRVRGAGHSDTPSIYTDAFDPMTGPQPAPETTNILLDKLRKWEETGSHIVVGAGHHLGVDPYARGDGEWDKNSLVRKLDNLKLSLDSLGGISHQTLGGFLSTGSAGASRKYELTEAIDWITLVDGTGEIRKLERGKNPEFDAAIVSMGLLGIIVEVGFSRSRLQPWFDLKMTSQMFRRVDFAPMTEKGKLDDFFNQNDYARILWWPQPGVDLVEVWTGQRVVPHDPSQPIVPYTSFGPSVQRTAHWLYSSVVEKLPHLFNDRVPAKQEWLRTRVCNEINRVLLEMGSDENAPSALQSPGAVAGATLQLLQSLMGIGGAPPQGGSAPEVPAESGNEMLLAAILNTLFEPFLAAGPVPAYDRWYTALPHDNQIDDDAIPIVFTESWVDVERADGVILALRKLFVDRRLAATGTLCFEIYPAKQRAAWLSPARPDLAGKGHDVLRVDPFAYWAGSTSREQAIHGMFALHWQCMKAFDFRSHWGKVLEPGCPESRTFREQVFPKLKQFKELRSRWDPYNVFVQDFWDDHLGLTPSYSP